MYKYTKSCIYIYTHVYVYTHYNTLPAFEPESETYGMCLNERIFSGRHRPMCPFVGDSFPVAPWDSSPLGTQWTKTPMDQVVSL